MHWGRHPLPPEQTPPRADTPWDQTPRRPDTAPLPPEQSILRDTVNARAVRILLECNLVVSNEIAKTQDFNKVVFNDVYAVQNFITCVVILA